MEILSDDVVAEKVDVVPVRSHNSLHYNVVFDGLHLINIAITPQLEGELENRRVAYHLEKNVMNPHPYLSRQGESRETFPEAVMLAARGIRDYATALLIAADKLEAEIADKALKARMGV